MTTFNSFVLILAGVALSASASLGYVTGLKFYRDTLLTSVVLLAAAVLSMILSSC